MSEVWLVDKSGKRRRGIIKSCKFCGGEFIARKHSDKRRFQFCSVDCTHEGLKNRCEVPCAQCGNCFSIRVSAKKNSKSGLHFCSRDCKDKAQRLGGIKEIMPPHYGTAEPKYRSFFEEADLFCRRCGYDEFTCSVDIHHIDRDRSNNERDNLIPLCACCHKGLHNGHWELEELQGGMVKWHHVGLQNRNSGFKS